MINCIMVGTDGSEQATKAVAWASTTAGQLNAELLVVHAFEIDPAKLPGATLSFQKEISTGFAQRVSPDWKVPGPFKSMPRAPGIEHC